MQSPNHTLQVPVLVKLPFAYVRFSPSSSCMGRHPENVALIIYVTASSNEGHLPSWL